MHGMMTTGTLKVSQAEVAHHDALHGPKKTLFERDLIEAEDIVAAVADAATTATTTDDEMEWDDPIGTETEASAMEYQRGRATSHRK